MSAAPKVRVAAFGVSLDGFAAGPRQDLDNPLGVGGPALMEWAFATRTFRTMHGETGGETGTDEQYAAESMSGIGAWILGRNMFGPVRGPWPDASWQGWWGEEPPYHCPAFVLTHHPRPSLTMKGGTVFHFVTDGIEAALARARAAAGAKDVRIGGGVSTVRQFLQARLIDELHLALRPVLLGQGEALFQDLDLPALGYEVAGRQAGERATHLRLRRRGTSGAGPP
ncbi:MAG TPA: dihydrofolate reductase family protein [Candidatus Polarisedimenticolia bacterium]|nr:dihydrofolate reductase family protein [Candidatus Polarisedimenticolia bacterium]